MRATSPRDRDRNTYPEEAGTSQTWDIVVTGIISALWWALLLKATDMVQVRGRLVMRVTGTLMRRRVGDRSALMVTRATSKLTHAENNWLCSTRTKFNHNNNCNYNTNHYNNNNCYNHYNNTNHNYSNTNHQLNIVT